MGNRKFYGFLVTVVLYTATVITAMFANKAAIADLSAFAVQASIGYCGIAGLFFASNVAEHFAIKKQDPK